LLWKGIIEQQKLILGVQLLLLMVLRMNLMGRGESFLGVHNIGFWTKMAIFLPKNAIFSPKIVKNGYFLPKMPFLANFAKKCDFLTKK
jgi:hypothetical protein